MLRACTMRTPIHLLLITLNHLLDGRYTSDQAGVHAKTLGGMVSVNDHICQSRVQCAIIVGYRWRNLCLYLDVQWTLRDGDARPGSRWSCGPR